MPVHDALALRTAARKAGKLLIGPNSTGILSAGRAKVGYFADTLTTPGRVGIITKGGSIAYGVLGELAQVGLGLSTIVSIGPDLVKGASYADLLPLFDADPETDVVLILGEIGGRDEEDAAEVIANKFSKPVVAHIAGRSLKPGATIGHAGAIIAHGIGGYDTKVERLRSAGAVIAETYKDIVPAIVASTAVVHAD